jgi:hypothetical protein
MIVIGTITFSEELANDVAQCYTTLPPLPDFISMTGTYVYTKEGEDIRAFAIFDFDESHADDATEYFVMRYDAFAKVKGLTSKLEEWINVQDALKVVEEGDFDINTLSTGKFF